MSVFKHTDANRVFRSYRLKDNRWETTSDIECDKVALTYSQQVLAVTSFSTKAISVFHRNEQYKNNIRLTFVPDNFPTELLWEIVNITKFGSVEVLKKGGPYETAQSMIVEDLCISDDEAKVTDGVEIDSCIGIRIFDLGMDVVWF